MTHRAFGWRSKFGVALASALVIFACGGSGDSTFNNGENNADGGNGNGNGNGNGFGNGAEGGGGGGEDDSGLAGCATTSEAAKKLPLDLYIMFDASGSMAFRAGRVSKYAAVSSAMSSFLADPNSSGIGVGLEFFPLVGQRKACTEDANCAAGSVCQKRICADGNNLCETNAQCAPGVACRDVGVCSRSNPNNPVYCVDDDSCDTWQGNWGRCQPTDQWECQRESCTVADYQSPSVNIAPLPAVAASINNQLRNRFPVGGTTTSAALQGAVNHAKGYAASHPGHTVVVVLATDGLPTLCDTNVDNVAKIAGQGLPAVKTFVIGVFTPGERAVAQTNLDKIAKGGGTNKAFVIDTDSDVAKEFAAALSTIRGSSLPCEYALPIPEAGTPDYSKLNVRYTPGNGGAPQVIGYATSLAGCNPTAGGWYYDADPAAGGKPTKVKMCRATCDKLKADPTGKIEVVQGCTTVVTVPK